MQHILVIDDDEMIRTVFKRFLKGQGYDVECAEDGREGLRMIEAKSPDLVITDIMMPDTDGLEVVLSMRERNPKTPVIAISGGMTTMPMDFLPMVKKFGTVKVYYKPVELEELLEGIRELLKPE